MLRLGTASVMNFRKDVSKLKTKLRNKIFRWEGKLGAEKIIQVMEDADKLLDQVDLKFIDLQKRKVK
jgi:hypothetical protein